MNEKLQKAGISGFKKNLKLEVLAKWCVDTGLDSKKILPEVQVIKLSDVLFKSRRKIYQYLVREISLQLSKNNLMLFSSSDVIPWKDKSSNSEITEKANSFCKNGVIHESPLRI